MKDLKGLVAVAASTLLFGCARMMFGTTETVKIYSVPAGATVTFPDGHRMVTPIEVQLDRKKATVITVGEKGYETETVTLQPVLSGRGLAFGGLYDYESGAVYELTPNPVSVVLKPTQKYMDEIDQNKTEEN